MNVVSYFYFYKVVKGVKGSYRFARPSGRELKPNALLVYSIVEAIGFNSLGSKNR